MELKTPRETRLNPNSTYCLPLLDNLPSKMRQKIDQFDVIIFRFQIFVLRSVFSGNS